MADQILPPNIDRLDTYDRKNFADQPAKFLRQDGSVTESIPASIVGGTVDVITNPVAITNANLDAPLSDIKANQTNATQKTMIVDGSGNIASMTSNAVDVNVDNIVTVQGTITATVDTSALATAANQGKFNGATSGLSTWKEVDGKPRVSAMPYSYDIAEGNVTGHTAWSKIGYNPAVTTSYEDIWSFGGEYVFPTSAMTIEVASDSATADADIGTILFNATCDAGGTTTTLIDAGVDFTATAAAGDILIVDKSGTVPEWGAITAVANGSLTFARGLSMGGSCATARTYQVLDASAAKGAMAVKIDYLDSTYAAKTEIIILNTNNQVSSVNSNYFRINSFRVIAVGTKATPTYAAIGNLSIRKATVASPFYSYITAGFTRARNSVYTVPLGKTLYVTQWTVGASTPNDTKVQTCRIFTRTNAEPATGFIDGGGIFYTYTEFLISNSMEHTEFVVPTKLKEMTDIRVGAVGLTGFSGPVTSVLRGWLE